MRSKPKGREQLQRCLSDYLFACLLISKSVAADGVVGIGDGMWGLPAQAVHLSLPRATRRLPWNDAAFARGILQMDGTV
jgi:hypothetical protein